MTNPLTDEELELLEHVPEGWTEIGWSALKNEEREVIWVLLRLGQIDGRGSTSKIVNAYQDLAQMRLLDAYGQRKLVEARQELAALQKRHDALVVKEGEARIERIQRKGLSSPK